MYLMESLGIISFVLLNVMVLGFIRHRYKIVKKQFQSGKMLVLDAGFFFSALFWLFFSLEPVLVMFQPDLSGYYVADMSEEHRYFLLSKAVMIGFVGYIFFVLGYNSKLIVSKELPYFSINDANPIIISVVIIFFFIMSVVGVYTYGIDKLVLYALSPEERMDSFGGTGYVFFVVQFYLVAVLIMYSYIPNQGGIYSIYRIILFVLPLFMIVFGGRTDIAQIWLALFLLEIMKHYSFSWRKLLITIGIMITFLGISLVFRKFNFGVSGVSIDESSVFATSLIWSIRHTLVPFDNFMSYLDVYDEHLSLLYGLPFIDIVLQVIPQGIIGEKPVEPGILLAQVIYPDSTGGTPFTIVGFLYANFLLPAVMVGMCAVGVLLRNFYEYYAKNHAELSVQILYSFVLSRLVIVVWGVYYAGVLGYVQFFIMFIIAYSILGKIKRKFVTQ